MYNGKMITNFKIFERSENSLFESNSEENMINDMFSRCDKKVYMKYISEADIELFSINDKFNELEARKYFLKDEYSIEVVEVEEQKLVSFYDYSNDIEDIIGNQPILLYHYTSSNLLKSIEKNGLKTGFKKTNPFSNSYSGVYLTTETSGQAVSNYAKIAVRKHGGKGIQLYIKTNFGNIEQDPDDADLRSGKFQFITEYVSPEQIIFYEEYFY